VNFVGIIIASAIYKTVSVVNHMFICAPYFLLLESYNIHNILWPVGELWCVTGRGEG